MAMYLKACPRCRGAVIFQGGPYSEKRMWCVNCGWALEPMCKPAIQDARFSSSTGYRRSGPRQRRYEMSEKQRAALDRLIERRRSKSKSVSA